MTAFYNVDAEAFEKVSARVASLGFLIEVVRKTKCTIVHGEFHERHDYSSRVSFLNVGANGDTPREAVRKTIEAARDYYSADPNETEADAINAARATFDGFDAIAREFDALWPDDTAALRAALALGAEPQPLAWGGVEWNAASPDVVRLTLHEPTGARRVAVIPFEKATDIAGVVKVAADARKAARKAAKDGAR